MPVQTPVLALSVCPCTALPAICGSAVLAGGDEPTAAVAAEIAVALPPSFVAVTATRIVCPASALVST